MDNSLILSGILIFSLAGVIVFLVLKLQRQGAAMARGQFMAEQLAEQKQTHEKLEAQLEQHRQDLSAARQSEQLALQKLQQAEKYREEWEIHRQEFEKAARNSVMAAGQELSSKLLADHKREAEEVKVKIEEKNRQHAEQFLQQFRSLTDSVAAVRQISEEGKKQSDILWRTMSSPNSAGQLTEVALGNLLKNLGLREGIDFNLQHSVSMGEGSGLRPDCVIYLPHDRLMIIDCKASKYQLELESAEGEEASAVAQEKFRLAMHKHLEMLSRKAYMTALADEYLQKTGRKPHYQVINVMYIASDAAVEKLDSLDSGFREKMQKAGIIAAGPSGLHGLCSIASMHIAEERKTENQERILHEIERLLSGFASALGHLEKLGNSLKSAATNFGNFTGSYNRSVAPKLRQLGKLGVKPEGKQVLPERMPVYELRTVDDWIVIEGQPEEEPSVVAEITDLSTQQVA